MSRQGEDNLRQDIGFPTTEGKEAGINGGSSLHGQLLVEDAASKGVERGVEGLENRGIIAIDDAGENWVSRTEVADGRI